MKPAPFIPYCKKCESMMTIDERWICPNGCKEEDRKPKTDDYNAEASSDLLSCPQCDADPRKYCEIKRWRAADITKFEFILSCKLCKSNSFFVRLGSKNPYNIIGLECAECSKYFNLEPIECELCPKCGKSDFEYEHVGPENVCGETDYKRCNICGYDWDHE